MSSLPFFKVQNICKKQFLFLSFFFLLYHSCGGKSMTKVKVFDFNVLIRLLFNQGGARNKKKDPGSDFFLMTLWLDYLPT